MFVPVQVDLRLELQFPFVFVHTLASLSLYVLGSYLECSLEFGDWPGSLQDAAELEELPFWRRALEFRCECSVFVSKDFSTELDDTLSEVNGFPQLERP